MREKIRFIYEWYVYKMFKFSSTPVAALPQQYDVK